MNLHAIQIAAVKIGRDVARQAFDKRAAGRPMRGTEIHLTELELAALLSLAAEKAATKILDQATKEIR